MAGGIQVASPVYVMVTCDAYLASKPSCKLEFWFNTFTIGIHVYTHVYTYILTLS